MNLINLIKKSQIISLTEHRIHGGIFPPENKSISAQLATEDIQLNNQIKVSQDDFQALSNWKELPLKKLLERIDDAEIIGLGGACFPTVTKLKNRTCNNNNTVAIDTLIINAMECEPYISCDDVLIQNYTDDILQGALISAKILNVTSILFGIEDNKLKAIEALDKIVSHYIRENNPGIQIKIIVVPTMYPSGGEKQIIQLLTGKQVPQKQYPSSLGIIVQNVATIFALKEAIIKGKRLKQRLVTITGDLARQPANYWLNFGTKLSDIIHQFINDESLLDEVILGGPLMGKSTDDFEQLTDASVNCIILNSKQQTSDKHQPCIRCAECQSVCPSSLIPQQLFWFSQAEQWQQAENQSIFDCIECGACDYVCPSEIPLVNYFKYAKSQINHNKEKLTQSALAKHRFDNREKRLARIKQKRIEKRKANDEIRKQASANVQKDPEGKMSAIEAALERVKMKKDNNEP